MACSTVAQIYNGAGVDSTIDGGGIITQDPNAISCSVFWENMVNNVNGGWIPDDNDNLIADPMFCAEDEHYGVYDISPCAPGNNECGILVGAGKINCIDSIPEITSPDSISVYEDSILAYRVTFIDADGPDTIITWDMHPSWLLHAADSTYGTPGEQTGDTSFLVIVSDGYRADSVLVNVNVIQVNDPPIIDSIGTKTAYEGVSFLFMNHGFDIDRDSVTLGTFDLPNTA